MEINEALFTAEVVWFLIGVVLLLLELAIPGLILIFFGVGACLVSFTLLFVDISFNTQLLLFLFSSITLLLILRQKLKKQYGGTAEDKNSEFDRDYIGKTAICTTAIEPKRDGTVEYNGSKWDATANEFISKNETVKIIGIESIKLIVEKY